MSKTHSDHGLYWLIRNTYSFKTSSCSVDIRMIVPNFTQVFKVRHVDNPCISLVLECRLQPRCGTAMLANMPPGDFMKLGESRLNKMPYENWRMLRVGYSEKAFIMKSVKTVASVKIQ